MWDNDWNQLVKNQWGCERELNRNCKILTKNGMLNMELRRNQKMETVKGTGRQKEREAERLVE